MPRIAVIQQAPVFLDRAATLARAVGALHEAAQAGAQLVVFPEAFIRGYPAWVRRLRPGPDLALADPLHARLRAEAVAGPPHDQFGMLVADIDLERVGLAQRSLDVAGHYARPAIFRLQVNTRAFAPVEFADHE